MTFLHMMAFLNSEMIWSFAILLSSTTALVSSSLIVLKNCRFCCTILLTMALFSLATAGLDLLCRGTCLSSSNHCKDNLYIVVLVYISVHVYTSALLTSFVSLLFSAFHAVTAIPASWLARLSFLNCSNYFLLRNVMLCTIKQ